ncbi:hypothetical protein [Streptodolium elevatio]
MDLRKAPDGTYEVVLNGVKDATMTHLSKLATSYAREAPAPVGYETVVARALREAADRLFEGVENV